METKNFKPVVPSKELELEVMAVFSEEKECEHPDHLTDLAVHYGETRWWLVTKCTGCNGESEVAAVCDGWRNFCMSTDNILICADCGTRNIAWDAVLSCKRI